MLVMRRLTYKYKLPGRSCLEVHDRLSTSLNVHQRGRELLFNDRKLTNEAFVNAILMYFLDHAPDRQRAILEEYIPALEHLLESKEGAVPTPELFREASNPGVVAVRQVADVLSADDPDPKAKRPNTK